MNIDICKNCKFFNERQVMVNGSYLCSFHKFTTDPENMGCYKIQFSNIIRLNIQNNKVKQNKK